MQGINIISSASSLHFQCQAFHIFFFHVLGALSKWIMWYSNALHLEEKSINKHNSALSLLKFFLAFAFSVIYFIHLFFLLLMILTIHNVVTEIFVQKGKLYHNHIQAAQETGHKQRCIFFKTTLPWTLCYFICLSFTVLEVPRGRACQNTLWEPQVAVLCSPTQE